MYQQFISEVYGIHVCFLQVLTRSDLVMVVTFPTGERITHHGDGTRIITYQDGSWVVESPGFAAVESRDGSIQVRPSPDATLKWQHDTGVISTSLSGGRSVVATCNAAVLIPSGGKEALEAALKVLPQAREQAELDRQARLEKRKVEREVLPGSCLFPFKGTTIIARFSPLFAVVKWVHP